MKKAQKFLTWICPLSLMIAGCAHEHSIQKTEAVKTPIHTSTQAAGAEMDRQMVTTISFNPGQRSLSASSAAEITKALREAHSKGDVEAIDVVVWSDMELPAKNQELPKRQVDLASDRAKNLESYIDKQAPHASIKTYNMAEEPSAWGRLIQSKDAELKTKLTALGFSPDADNDYDSGRTSTALVMIKIK